MSSAEGTQRGARFAVRNVGGIDRTEVDLQPGVTILAGRNATNRTSLLRAMMAALGSDDVSLKGDADEGRVELAIDGETYTRTLERSNGAVTTGGDPYLADAETADLFAFLLESNEARRAVARGEDLRELIMRPVDTDELQAEIRRLESEKRELDTEIEELEQLQEELPGLEQERADLETEIEETREELAELEAEIDQHSGELSGDRDEQSELEATLEELREARNDLEELRYDVETEQRSIDALEEERAELRAEREDYPDAFDELDDLEAEIERLRARTSEIASTIRELGTIIQFNEDLLEGSDAALVEALADEDAHDTAVTDSLVADDGTVCWTCGSEVGADQIDATLDRLREFRQQQRRRQRSLEEEIDELETEKIGYEEKRRQRDQIEQRLDAIERELEQRESNLSDLRDRRERQAGRVEELEAAVDELETDEHGELLELHEAANEKEFDLGRLQTQLGQVEDDIERIERQCDDLDGRRERRETVGERLDELRTRIQELQDDAVEAFNEHMAALLDLLAYDNLERIWIERVAGGTPGQDEASFDLHVVRSTDDGVTYEDTVGHLSESEREVTGLVVALAGYLVHDVADASPFMLLDSLEAIDADRIASLVDYFADYARFLVVALLPEDAAALDDDYDRVTDI